MTIDKTFDPAAIETRWYRHWEETGAFRPARPQAEPYTIVIPPPNVTGSLHIGHALDNTLQDILIRFERLRGKDALWVVGTDHAGIATQMVVERLLDAEGVKRADLGRDAFEARVWKWKDESGGQITRQLRRLGASCDWANERFTMDEGFSAAVRKVFVDLYRQGLIYRDKRLVNWDPKLLTAISDLEVEMREVDGHMWHFRYPLADGQGHIAIATTRPETILGDGAVAVHPDDDRYRHLVGKLCRLPIVERLIAIIADPHVEADFGSGAVKITAAHDFNDFAVYQRHPDANIPLINLMTPDARMNDACPKAYRGLTREEARLKVVADFDTLGLLDKVEPHRHNVPHGDRSGVVIEPYLTDQWYVNAAELAKAPMAAVRSGETKFVPQTWEKTFFQWMENIQPWCVSRQLWWGHRIPAWYGPKKTDTGISLKWSSGPDGAFLEDEAVFVGLTENEVIRQASEYYDLPPEHFKLFDTVSQAFEEHLRLFQNGLQGIPLGRDPDVLDTWFSSALWPFGTIGWPSEALPHFGRGLGGGSGHAPTSDAQHLPTPTPPHAGEGLLAKHYPNSTLVTGFDIIFFWVARMQMMGHHVMGAPPFGTVYCHGLVRDSKGQKMSKSRGNTVDPLGLIDKYGADALRFFMAAMESQGRDIKMSEPRLEGYRNFATKLWNAARFAQSNGIGGSDGQPPPPADNAVNQWIIAETQACAHAVTGALEAFRFDEAANMIYAHTWGRFCDWYLELTKPILAEPGPAADETRAVAGWALDQILVLLHPFMPFITEELWHALKPRAHDVILAKWPQGAPMDPADEAAAQVHLLIRFISAFRTMRAELDVPFARRLSTAVAKGASSRFRSLFDYFGPQVARLCKLDRVQFEGETGILYLSETVIAEGGSIPEWEALSRGWATIVLPEVTFAVRLEGIIDLDAQSARLRKFRDAAAKEAASLRGRLANPGFLAKAAPEAVDKAREDLGAREAEAVRLSAALERLG